MSHIHAFEVWLSQQLEPAPIKLSTQAESVKGIEVQIESHFAKMRIELSAWETFALKRFGKKDARPFDPESTRGDIADWVASQLALVESKTQLRGIFEKALADYETNVIKTIQATRLDFENTFDSLLMSAMREEIDRRKWGIRVRALIAKSCQKAYRDGLSAGGVVSEPDDEEQEMIAVHIEQQSRYVTNFGDVLFKDGITASEAMGKGQMWYNKSIYPMYLDGFGSAKRNQMMEFYGNDGMESCIDCKRLKRLPDRHRLKDWIRKLARPVVDAHYYECGGWQCKHGLRPVTGKAQGSF